MTKIAFVCVGNAGRSQMATALAERERDTRALDIEIVTGGVDPADSVHDDVIEALQEEGIDISDRKPREITPADIEDATHVVTMGCSVEQFQPDGWSGESEVWDLDASDTGAQLEEFKRRVSRFFDNLSEEEQ
ncbi:low molecular weight phosphatase family protein [Natronosalvus halobius]|uniref:arsenate-mycothiol transferase ArsC n=1 Tax=Natronosalvus halobius TaxID=2953746 RepID=UPI0020A04B48|nr:low molecular weight phosphatase family protein [Natronosalvus halobius]USZ73505.1 low molecular weight phosphatase family protein [Natronosalvus halobius]